MSPTLANARGGKAHAPKLLEKRCKHGAAKLRTRQAKAGGLRRKYDASTVGCSKALQRVMEETGLKRLLPAQFGRHPARPPSPWRSSWLPSLVTHANYEQFTKTTLARDRASCVRNPERIQPMLDETTIRTVLTTLSSGTD